MKFILKAHYCLLLKEKKAAESSGCDNCKTKWNVLCESEKNLGVIILLYSFPAFPFHCFLSSHWNNRFPSECLEQLVQQSSLAFRQPLQLCQKSGKTSAWPALWGAQGCAQEPDFPISKQDFGSLQVLPWLLCRGMGRMLRSWASSSSRFFTHQHLLRCFNYQDFQIWVLKPICESLPFN